MFNLCLPTVRPFPRLLPFIFIHLFAFGEGLRLEGFINLTGLCHVQLNQFLVFAPKKICSVCVRHPCWYSSIFMPEASTAELICLSVLPHHKGNKTTISMNTTFMAPQLTVPQQLVKSSAASVQDVSVTLVRLLTVYYSGHFTHHTHRCKPQSPTICTVKTKRQPTLK